MRVADRTVVITGAASGIGAALARVFAAAGANLALADVSPLEPIAAELAAAGRKVSTHRVDVSSRAQIQAFAAEVQQAHGGAHILINNAGVTTIGPFEEQPAEDFDRLMSINLGGVVEGCRAFLPMLRAADQGYIVNISSIFGIVAVPAQVAYCTSKFAVRGFSEALAEELRGSTVGLTVVHPGGVTTRIVEDARRAGAQAEANHARMARRFQRAGMPAERAAACILNAVVKERPRLVIAPGARPMDLARRLAPVWGNRVAVAVMGRALGITDSRASDSKK